MCIVIGLFLVKHLFIPIVPLEQLEQTQGRLINILTPKRKGNSLFILQTDKGQRTFSWGRVLKNREPYFDKALGKNVIIWSQHTRLLNFPHPNRLRQLRYNEELILDYSGNYKRGHSFRRFSLWANPILLFIGFYMPVRMWVNYRK